MLDKRTNVLLNQTDYHILSRIAKEKNTTVSDLIRYDVRKTFDLTDTTERKQLLAEFRRLGKGLVQQPSDIKELVNDGRKY